jgi:hypothetical protein
MVVECGVRIHILPWDYIEPQFPHEVHLVGERHRGPWTRGSSGHQACSNKTCCPPTCLHYTLLAPKSLLLHPCLKNHYPSFSLAPNSSSSFRTSVGTASSRNVAGPTWDWAQNPLSPCSKSPVCPGTLVGGGGSVHE